MSIHLHALVEHQGWMNAERLAQVLAPVLPDLQAIEAFWRRHDPEYKPYAPDSWLEDETFTFDRESYSGRSTGMRGPATILFEMGERFGLIRTHCRWRAFLCLPTVREVHATAFRSVAKCLKSSFVAYFPQNDSVLEALVENKSKSGLFQALRRQYGEPRLDVDIAHQELLAIFPSPWYIERVDDLAV